MYIFHHDLEAVEKFGLWILDFANKILSKIFVNNSIGSRKKGEDVIDEMLSPGSKELYCSRSSERSTSSAVQKLASAFL